ncbi:YARHG domain-containing protein [Flavobacterium suzhouense]|uniref:YARHG domain-containing protein n=1 Tax=Flavobacterium suzhouense TaxID=1529638 RepID=A0ABW5NSM8_9FLAO
MLAKDLDDAIVEWDTPLQRQDTITDEDGEEHIYLKDIYRVASDEIFNINASTDTLTEESLKNLRKLDLEIVRNCVFARHGYSFKKSSLRYFFDFSDWYVPVSNNVDKDLTVLEKQNIALLKRMEEYATDHYDTFGR